MDPKKAPNFIPPSDREPYPLPSPREKIPVNDPIQEYVVADYNNSLDAPISQQERTVFKLNMAQKSRGGSISTKEKEHEPISPVIIPGADDVLSNDEAIDDDSVVEFGPSSESSVPRLSQIPSFSDIVSRKSFLGADLEEVPHGIVRQAKSIDGYSFPSHRLKKRLRNDDKHPLVVVACGSFSPITYLHLRMFEMALDAISENTKFQVIGGYYSPVSDHYKKSGLAPAYHRVRMCELACERTSSWLMVDAWESLQPQYTRTALVLDHFNEEINVKRGGVLSSDGRHKRGVKIMLLAGGDLIVSMGEPNVWAENDLHHILGSYGCLIVERTGSDVRSFLLSHDILYEHRKNILVIKQLIYNDISSTKVRLFIRRGMSVQYLLPNSVIRYILEHKLYVGTTEPVKQVMGNSD